MARRRKEKPRPVTPKLAQEAEKRAHRNSLFACGLILAGCLLGTALDVSSGYQRFGHLHLRMVLLLADLGSFGLFAYLYLSAPK